MWLDNKWAWVYNSIINNQQTELKMADLVELAVEQIIEDVLNKNTDAIYALLLSLKRENLVEFLVTEE